MKKATVLIALLIMLPICCSDSSQKMYSLKEFNEKFSSNHLNQETYSFKRSSKMYSLKEYSERFSKGESKVY